MLETFNIDAQDYDGPVLVTGAGGCIGSWALALLTRAGAKAVAFDLVPDTRRPRLLMSEAELGRIDWLTGDVADAEAVLHACKTSNARAVLHLAALQVPFCKADAVLGAKVNVVGTRLKPPQDKRPASARSCSSPVMVAFERALPALLR